MQPFEFPPWYDLRPSQRARLATVLALERQGPLRLRGTMRELRALQWLASHIKYVGRLEGGETRETVGGAIELARARDAEGPRSRGHTAGERAHGAETGGSGLHPSPADAAPVARVAASA